MGACRRHIVNRRAPTPALPQRGRGQSPSLLPQGQALLHAKAMLLVDDGQAQTRELHLRLDDGMRADDQRRRAAFNGGQHGRALFLLLAASQPCHALATRRQQGGEPVGQLGEVLLGQDLGGRHQRALPAGVDGHAGGQRRHHRLAAAHVALQQAVHGLGARQVGGDFLAHAALRAGQVEGQRGQQLLGQAAARRVQGRRPQAGALGTRLVLRQLLRQQLLGLQALPGRVAVVLQFAQRRVGRWVVQKCERLAQVPRAQGIDLA